MNMKTMKTQVCDEKKVAMKEKAIELLQKLDIYKPYITGFKKKGDICFFEAFAGFWAYQDKELMKKVKEIEEQYGCLVYAVTHEYFEFGECYSLLIVSSHKSEWPTLVEDLGNNTFSVYAYVWNKDEDMFSEFGDVGIRSFGGGLRRWC